jgi:hypothetical protein
MNGTVYVVEMHEEDCDTVTHVNPRVFMSREGAESFLRTEGFREVPPTRLGCVDRGGDDQWGWERDGDLWVGRVRECTVEG